MLTSACEPLLPTKCTFLVLYIFVFPVYLQNLLFSLIQGKKIPNQQLYIKKKNPEDSSFYDILLFVT